VGLRGVIIAVGVSALLAGCSGIVAPRLALTAPKPAERPVTTGIVAVGAVNPSGLDPLIAKYAALYNVPEALIRRVVVRESGYNPKARNGPYYGLMQIRYDTAMSMGYRGPASGLLDADTNLRYGVKYLSGAYLVAGYNADGAVRNYSRGYYYDAKAKGLLEEVGLR
jgi:soluble lytic murein transglycosylase-like protein